MHEHDEMEHAGRFDERAGPLRRDYAARAFTVGIGGPVGSGKTALVLALCRALRERLSLGVVTNDIFTREDAEFLVRNQALPPERIRAVETGGCPHAAIREDISHNLLALEQLIEVAGGDKVPRKGGPGITQSDLLVINKTDLAPQVGADLAVMARDARRMRGDGPVVFAQCTHGVGIAEVVAAVLAARSAALGADSLEGDALRPAPGRIHDP